MLRIYKIIISISVIYCAGCSSGNEAKIETIKLYDDNGKLQYEFETIDSVRQGKAISYYPDGKIKSKFNFKDDLENGPALSYYPNGKIQKVGIFLNGKENGESTFYYENGNINIKCKYYNDLIVGNYFEYFEEVNRRIKSVKEFVIIKNKSHLNSFIKYDINGKVVDESSRLFFSETKDSLQIGINKTNFENLRMITGKYDLFFNQQEKDLDTIKSLNNKFVRIKFHKGDTIRGYIDNYEILDSQKVISRHIWFSYPNPW